MPGLQAKRGDGHMRIGLIGILAAALLAGACDTSAPGNVRDTTGRVLGTGAPVDVPASESFVSFDETAPAITRYVTLSLPQTAIQTYAFREGFGRYSRTLVENSFYMSTTDTSIGMIDLVLGSVGRTRGIEADRSQIVRGNVRSGRYAYLRGKAGAAECSAYQLLFNHSVVGLNSGYTAYMSGYWCGDPGQSREKVDADTVRFLNSIHYDGGLLNRARAALAPRPSPIPTPMPAAPAPVATAPAPAPAPVPAPVQAAAGEPAARIATGDFLRTATGGFRVTGATPELVTLSNTGGQSSRWIGGFFFLPRGTSAAYAQAVVGMHPLRVGQEAEMHELGGNADRWVHAVKVLREEPIVLADRAYPCFVIEIREKAATPAQGNYEYLRTVWYSPDLGVLLRFRSRNVVDGRTTNWDIAEIVRRK
ncbi:MAG: hypothetical protein JNL71_00585 [Rhodospirillales bacterium]|nr:hypothetical protein [Rhodospirillales bacterium]